MVVPLIQARMNSDRLPGKVLMHINGQPLLYWIVQAAKGCGDPVVVTPIGRVNDPIRSWCKSHRIRCSSWPVEGVRDPLAEFAYAVRQENSDTWIVRLTADCPMLRAHHVSLFASILAGHDNIFTNRPADMDGFDLEGFRVSMLRRAFKFAKGDEREHICPWMYRNCWRSDVYSAMGNPNDGVAPGKVSVDTKEEYEMVKRIMEGAA